MILNQKIFTDNTSNKSIKKIIAHAGLSHGSSISFDPGNTPPLIFQKLVDAEVVYSCNGNQIVVSGDSLFSTGNILKAVNVLVAADYISAYLYGDLVAHFPNGHCGVQNIADENLRFPVIRLFPDTSARTEAKYEGPYSWPPESSLAENSIPLQLRLRLSISILDMLDAEVETSSVLAAPRVHARGLFTESARRHDRRAPHEALCEDDKSVALNAHQKPK